MSMKFNSKFFEELGRSPGVERLVKESAERVLEAAKESAPVKTGAYREGLILQKSDRPGRVVYRVYGADPKTLLIENLTGNLARALRRAGKK